MLDGNVDPVAWNDTRTGRTLSTFDRLQTPLGAETGLQTLLGDCAAAGPARCPFAAGPYPVTAGKYRTLLQQLHTQQVTVNGVAYGYALTTITVAEQLESEQPAPSLNLIG